MALVWTVRCDCFIFIKHKTKLV